MILWLEGLGIRLDSLLHKYNSTTPLAGIIIEKESKVAEGKYQNWATASGAFHWMSWRAAKFEYFLTTAVEKDWCAIPNFSLYQ